MDAFVGMIIGFICCACIWFISTVTSYEYEHVAAEAACLKNGGYSEIQRDSRHTFVCKDGARFEVKTLEDNRK